jgi:uncharacterized membrane protein YccC
MMQVVGSIAALAVAVIFYVWRAWWRRRLRTLHDRVAYMLWVAAQKDEATQPSQPAQ